MLCIIRCIQNVLFKDNIVPVTEIKRIIILALALDRFFTSSSYNDAETIVKLWSLRRYLT